MLIPTPTLGIGSTCERPADGMTMVYVPSGEFDMGDDSSFLLSMCKQSCRIEQIKSPSNCGTGGGYMLHLMTKPRCTKFTLTHFGLTKLK